MATLPVALEQISGPFPRWRIPSIDSRIPRGLQKIYVADIIEPFTLALVRDVDGDFPLLFALESFSTDTITVGDLIGGSLGGRARPCASVRLLSSSSDIQKLVCNSIQEEIQAAYSTTIFILLNDDPIAYRFRNKYSQVPPPLRLTLPLCRSLVESAPRLEAFDFQGIGLARALLHVAICLAEAAMASKVEGATEAYLISRLNNLVDKLNDILLAIESSTESSLPEIRHSMDRFFYELCEEQPGAVSVRQFFESFKPLIPFDYENTRSTYEGGSEVQDEQTLVAQHGSKEPANTSAPEAEDDSTGSSDSLTLSDGESVDSAHEQLPDSNRRMLAAANSPQSSFHRLSKDGHPYTTDSVSTTLPTATPREPFAVVGSRLEPVLPGYSASNQPTGRFFGGTVSPVTLGRHQRNRRYVGTYTLNGTTTVVGEERGNAADAKESAARAVFRLCESWERSK